MKYILLASLFLVCLYGKCQEYSTPPEFAQKVYDDIYSTMSDGKTNKPRLFVSDEPSEVATFDPSGSEPISGGEPIIKLGVNFIELVRNFGKDSSNALAHVLGHELAHVILRQNDMINIVGSGYASTEFNKEIKKYKNILRDSLFERQADEYAALYAHMSGYKTTGLGVVLLDSIYTRFKLTDPKLSRYPSLKERKEIVIFSEKKMSVLNKMFDASILCILSENYEMGDALNRAIKQENFSSREIHNNLGVSALVQGIHLLDTLEYPYDFPIALDISTRLNTTQERSIGADAKAMLEIAHEHLMNATEMSATYYSAWLNDAVVQFILGDEKLYNIAIINLSDCTDSEILNKLEVLKSIKENFNSRKRSETPYAALCKKGNEYACGKISQEQKLKTTWPTNLSFIESFENPRFDFKSEESKKADTLRKTLSVTKNDFRYRRLIQNGIIGESWNYLKGTKKQVDIYTIKSQSVSESDLSVLENNCQFIGFFNKNAYFRYKEIYIVIKDEQATFYFIN